MQVLSIQEEQRLLRLLFSCDAKTFSAIRSDFSNAFVKQEDRLRACCAALLLLEDSRALSTAQRLGTWYTLYAGWDAQQGSSTSTSHISNPFMNYLVEVPTDVRRSAVERHLVLQLLRDYQMPQLDGRSPLDYAMSYSLPLTCGELGLESVRAQLAAGQPPSPGADLDSVLQDKKRHLMTLAAAALAQHVAAAGPQGNGSTHSSVCGPGSQPSTPARHLPGVASSPTTPLPGRPSSTAGLLMSHPLTGDLGGPVGVGPGAAEWTADGDSSVARTSSSGGSAATSSSNLGPILELMERALQGPLMPMQQNQVLDAMSQDPSIITKLGVGPAQLPALVEHAPNIAVDLLTRLASTPAFPDFLAALAHSDMSLHSMEVVNHLTTCMALPTEFLHLYIANCINSCHHAQDKYVQSRLVRLLCVFIQSLIRNRIINIAELLHEVQAFCVEFSRIREAAKLFRLLKQIESGGKLVLVDGLSSPTASAGNALDAAESSD